MANILSYNGAPLALNGAPISCNAAGTDTSDATITSAAQILYPYTGYSQGIKYTGSIQSQAAQTIYPSTSDQTIASGQYLSGIQTIKGVVLTNLLAENIKNGVTIEVGDSADSDRITSVIGTYQSSRNYISGIQSSSNSQTLTISNLLGTPRVFYLQSSNYGGLLNRTIISTGGYGEYCLGPYMSGQQILMDNIHVTTTSNSITLQASEGYFYSNISYVFYYAY